MRTHARKRTRHRRRRPLMPLVRLFAHKALTKAIPLPRLQAKLCEIWGVKPQTTKLLLTRVDDWTSDQFDEDVYVSVRAKATPDRTRDVVLEGCRQWGSIPRRCWSQRARSHVGMYFHLPPPASSHVLTPRQQQEQTPWARPGTPARRHARGHHGPEAHGACTQPVQRPALRLRHQNGRQDLLLQPPLREHSGYAWGTPWAKELPEEPIDYYDSVSGALFRGAGRPHQGRVPGVQGPRLAVVQRRRGQLGARARSGTADRVRRRNSLGPTSSTARAPPPRPSCASGASRHATTAVSNTRPRRPARQKRDAGRAAAPLGAGAPGGAPATTRPATRAALPAAQAPRSFRRASACPRSSARTRRRP